VALEAKDVSSVTLSQDLATVRNRITIEGIEQGAFSTAKDKMTSRMVCAATSDAASIAAYLEKTYSVTNDLFQDQASLDAMAATVLAAYKDPKWYAVLEVPHNAIPLDLGDTIDWESILRPASGTDLGLKVRKRGIVRSISLSDSGFSYTVEMESGLMNVSNHTAATVTVTTEQTKGWMLTTAGAGADVQFNLPAAVVGMRITFFVLAAQTVTVNPSGTERLAVLTGAAGDYVRSDNVIGSYLTLVCLVAGYWHKLDIAGTWT
jgi:hypothetical protein